MDGALCCRLGATKNKVSERSTFKIGSALNQDFLAFVQTRIETIRLRCQICFALLFSLDPQVASPYETLYGDTPYNVKQGGEVNWPTRYTVRRVLLKRAVEAEYPEIVDLVNIAFRGKGPAASWNAEGGILEGQRLNEALLREDIAAKPEARLLTHRDAHTGLLSGSVWLYPTTQDVWYLGMLSIRPELQKKQLGRGLLAAAEAYAKEHGARCIRMTVINIRDTLIAWYERRGYALTGETQPFPYGDDRFGKPLRDDLEFLVLEKKV